MKFSDLNKLKDRQAAPAPKNAPVKREEPRRVPEPQRARPEEKPAAQQPVETAAPKPAAAETPAVIEPPKHAAQPPRADRPKLQPHPAELPTASYRELYTKAGDIYARMVAQAAELLSHMEQPYTEQYEAVLRACKTAAQTLKINPVLLNYTAYSTSADYLHAHTANTAILSMAIGRAAGLEDADIEFIGFCAMAHDAGMTDFKDLAARADRLSEEEFAEITTHPEAGMRKLDRIVDLDYKLKERARRIVMQTHERLDGSGYPDRLAGDEIDPFAQIIGIADVYEAMTHPRAWREAINPPDVIRELIEKEGSGFSSKTVKALIATLSIYPPNSIVELTTHEIARVIKVNSGSLTKPLVEVLLDAGFEQAQARTVDLLQYPLTSIERPVPLSEIAARNQGFAERLEASRWWTE